MLKRTPSITASIAGDGSAEGKTVSITVTVPRDATGRCFAIIENKTSGVIYETEYCADVINSKAKIPIPGLSAGKYIAHVRYSGNDKYLPLSVDSSVFTITKVKTPGLE